MSCELDFSELSAWVDGELSDERADQVREHVEQCEACREQADILGAGKHRLAKIGAKRAPTDATRRQIERAVEAFRGDGTDREQGGAGTPRNRTILTAAVAVAGIAVASALFVGGGGAGTNAANWAEMFVIDHLHSRPAAKPMDVASDDPKAVASFFAPKVSFDPVVPRFSGAELLGGRDCTLDGDRVQLLFYRADGRVLSLFVSDDLRAPETCRRFDGQTVCVREHGPLRLMMVGSESPDRLRRRLASAEF
ncbi:MAG: anti-sigma factor [Bradymonadaceae bacterium]